MIKIILGTTPTIKYIFKIVKPSDIETAILTIIDRTGTEKLRKTLDDATVGTDSIEWTLTQAETLSFGLNNSLRMMLNWVTRDGTRGASTEETVVGASNHIREVI